VRNWSGEKIDGDTDVVRPFGRVGAGAAQHIDADRRDQSGLLGDRNELGRRHHAPLRMMPTQQRLEAGDLAAVQLDQRLVMHLERAGRHCIAQIDLEPAARLQAGVHLRLEEAAGTLAVALGAVERHVGVFQKPVGIVGVVRRERNADRGADGDEMAVEIVRIAEDFDDALGQRGNLLRRLDVGLQHGEFVAAEPRHRVLFAQRAFEPRADLLQQEVAVRMAERVVDGLEIVEVDAQSRQAEAIAAHARQHLLHAQAQEHPVRQRGERVVMRHEGDARFGALALRDVDGGDQRRRLVIPGEQAREDGDVDRCASALRWRQVRPVVSTASPSRHGRSGCSGG